MRTSGSFGKIGRLIVRADQGEARTPVEDVVGCMIAVLQEAAGKK